MSSPQKQWRRGPGQSSPPPPNLGICVYLACWPSCGEGGRDIRQRGQREEGRFPFSHWNCNSWVKSVLCIRHIWRLALSKGYRRNSLPFASEADKLGIRKGREFCPRFSPQSSAPRSSCLELLMRISVKRVLWWSFAKTPGISLQAVMKESYYILCVLLGFVDQ